MIPSLAQLCENPALRSIIINGLLLLLLGVLFFLVMSLMKTVRKAANQQSRVMQHMEQSEKFMKNADEHRARSLEHMDRIEALMQRLVELNDRENRSDGG